MKEAKLTNPAIAQLIGYRVILNPHAIEQAEKRNVTFYNIVKTLEEGKAKPAGGKALKFIRQLKHNKSRHFAVGNIDTRSRTIIVQTTYYRGEADTQM